MNTAKIRYDVCFEYGDGEVLRDIVARALETVASGIRSGRLSDETYGEALVNYGVSVAWSAEIVRQSEQPGTA
jgi:hypothetical protein